MIWSGLGMSKRYCTRSRQQLSSSPWILPLPKPFILGVSEMPFAGFDRCRIVVNWISLWRPQLPREKTPPKHVTSYSFGYFKYRFFPGGSQKKNWKRLQCFAFFGFGPFKRHASCAMKKTWLFGVCKGDYTTQLSRDYEKTWKRSLFNNQESMERNASCPPSKSPQKWQKSRTKTPRASIGSKDS